MQRINQNMTGYRMPAYVEEILTENYCKNFVRMSIVRESGNYSFSYKPAGLSRLDPSSMKLYDKLLLIRNLISMSENTSDHLIGADSYLLEPELVYVKEGEMAERIRSAAESGDINRLKMFLDKVILRIENSMN